jgi:protein-tyrosine phosphatase
VINWFKSKGTTPDNAPTVDMHSHLLPGIDDGAKTIDDSIALITRFRELGYTRLITTPHVMSDYYRNTPEIIREKLQDVRNALREKKIDMEISAAAEYYLDEDLLRKVEQEEELLSLGNNFLLFETNFMTEPFHLKEFIFKASTKQYKPVLAHPERYLYLQQDFSKAEDLIDRGVYFQLNILSLTGHYSKSAQQLAFRLIDNGWIHFVGSDCHHEQHLTLLEEARRHKYFKKVLTLPLLNHTLGKSA